MHLVLARHDHLRYAMLRRISGVDQFPASLRSIRIEHACRSATVSDRPSESWDGVAPSAKQLHCTAEHL